MTLAHAEAGKSIKNAMENKIKKYPMVGVGVIVLKDGKVLLGKRSGSHGTGEYSTPGGHMEYMESFEDCAKRETKEECGIEIENVKFQFLANMKEYAPKHYVHIGVIAEWKSGEPKVLESDHEESWDWYDLDNLPSPLFIPTGWAIDSFKTGFIFKDSIK
jgi:8-oxo-dGTP diphosphatase